VAAAATPRALRSGSDRRAGYVGAGEGLPRIGVCVLSPGGAAGTDATFRKRFLPQKEVQQLLELAEQADGVNTPARSCVVARRSRPRVE
jgi:hypothetical protein